MSPRTVVVTGGAGHVGSHLVELLVADPRNRVISLDNYSTGRVENHVAGAEYRRGDTKDIAACIPETPELLFHLGEYARVNASFSEPAKVYEFNVAGTFAVTELCRARGVGKLVYAASSTKFAIEGDGRHQSPYAFAKATNVDLIMDYGRWYSLPFAICYFYNAFGPREVGEGKYATLIAKFEQLTRRGAALPVHAPGTQRRAFTHVNDLARGIALVGEAGAGDGYALRAENSYSVIDVAKAFGGPIEMVNESPGRSDVDNDPIKARELGWRPTIDVMDYIRDFRAGLGR